MVLFDASNHSYWLGGRRLPSVTEVLRWSGEIPEDNWRGPSAVKALARGRRVHRAAEAICRGREDLVPMLIMPGEEGYVDAWRSFLTHLRPAWGKVEATIYEPTLRLSGTVDRAGFMAGRPVVVDLKTGDRRPWHALQLALYEMALRAETPIVRERVGVHLSAAGEFTLQVYSKRDDYARARALAEDWRDAHGDEEEDRSADGQDFAALAED